MITRRKRCDTKERGGIAKEIEIWNQDANEDMKFLNYMKNNTLKEWRTPRNAARAAPREA